MAVLRPIRFEGVYTHPATGRHHAYQVTCQVVINLHGWESMHVRGTVACGGQDREFAVLGHVDPGCSFIGREAAVAADCVALACQRAGAGQPPAVAARHSPSAWPQRVPSGGVSGGVSGAPA